MTTKRKPARAVAADQPDPVAEWELLLYVAGQTPASLAAIANLTKLCEEHLAGKYSIRLIDLLKEPRLARENQIVAVPTLVRRLPPPLRKIIGDLSDRDRTLVGLQLKSRITQN